VFPQVSTGFLSRKQTTATCLVAVKGSQVQILSARPKTAFDLRKRRSEGLAFEVLSCRSSYQIAVFVPEMALDLHIFGSGPAGRQS
jgi:hypothetical protein